MEVRQGSRYRFRVASNGIMNCPLKVSVDNHTMDIIAMDGFDVEPVTVQYFNMFAGERWVPSAPGLVNGLSVSR